MNSIEIQATHKDCDEWKKNNNKWETFEKISLPFLSVNYKNGFTNSIADSLTVWSFVVQWIE